MNEFGRGSDASSISRRISLGELARDREPEPAPGRAPRRRRGRSARRPGRLLRADARPVVLDDQEARARRSRPARTRTRVPARRVHDARSRPARARSGASAARRRGRSRCRRSRGSSECSLARATSSNSSTRSAATRDRGRRGSRSTRMRPASSRERSSSSVGQLGQAVDLLPHPAQELAPRRARRGPRPASSSRKPPRENSGVRSSCDALAMNSRRACSSPARRRRMRSKARASWPSSSGLESSIGLVELAARDPLGSPLEAADAAGEDARAAEAEQESGDERDHCGDQNPVLDEGDGRQRVLERARDEHDVLRLPICEWLRYLRVLLATAPTTPRVRGQGPSGGLRRPHPSSIPTTVPPAPSSKRSLSVSGLRFVIWKITTRVFEAEAKPCARSLEGGSPTRSRSTTREATVPAWSFLESTSRCSSDGTTSR